MWGEGGWGRDIGGKSRGWIMRRMGEWGRMKAWVALGGRWGMGDEGDGGLGMRSRSGGGEKNGGKGRGGLTRR